MQKNIVLGAIVALIVLGGGWWYLNNSFSHPLPLAEGDSISSWYVNGSYKDGAELEKRVTDEIARLEGLFGNPEGEPTDYILHVSIANQYELLGDGKRAYEHLGRAVALDPEKTTGLAWHNLGSLLARLGALNTARIAYSSAVEAQPHIEQYHITRLTFLMENFSDDTGAIEAAFSEMEGRFAGSLSLLQLKASWEEIGGSGE